MIDELVKIADAKDNACIVTNRWHPKLKVLPQVKKNAPCVRIWLAEDGHINDLDLLTEEHIPFLRKYEPDLGRSLPGFNVRPLYRLVRSEEECRKHPKEIEAALKKGDFDRIPLSLRRPEDDFWQKTRIGLKWSFGVVREELESICADRLQKGETLRMLFDAVKQIDVNRFQEEYGDALRQKIESGQFPLSLMCYFVTAKKKLKEDSDSKTQVPKISVFLDISAFNGHPVSHEKTINRLNSLLMDRAEVADYSVSAMSGNNQDAYGFDASQMTDKFPGVALPYLGGVILRSQAKTIPAQKRYHQCESSTFPVGKETRERIKAALEWIADKERDGETYGVAGERELVFAYPRILPKGKIPFAKMLGAQLELGEEKFERLAKSVIEQLKGLGREAADAELEIFSLRKMDKARTKVVYYRNATVTSLETASKFWYEGCRNIPPLDIRGWSKEKDEQTGKSYPVRVEGETVFPVKLHRYLNAVWKRNGERADTGKTKVNVFAPADGLRLLLEESSNALATHMIERFMQHAQGYFIKLCRTQCRIDKNGRYEIAELPDKEYCPGILGLLLYNLGKQKEIFMNESAFLLGRFLRVADEIHRLYCEVVRKRDLPSELCGSSMLVAMMESPGTALDQLAMRSAPYVKWAGSYRYQDEEKKNESEQKNIRSVRFWWRHWADVTDHLRELRWPKRLEPEERAQVFLGYLSSFSQKGQTGSTISNSVGNSNQGE